ncbi:DNA-binding SARP family transcriptional activator [Streptomyces sp. V4I8]|uniref:AfsR/SARP family transcriptional regulator n=1 Tax=Streptomyces sp. V4I8 TaxID=3156469 RepID=UPI003516A12F
MRYELLGSLRVVTEDGSRFITARKTATLLATLLVRADQIVPRELLITELWGSSPPRRADAALHVYISQLRKFLSRPGERDSPIATRPPGYLLRTDGDELDVREFQRLVETGRAHAHAGRHDQAAAALEQALAVWRGPVPDDLRDGPVVADFATWIEELYLECAELLVTSHLALGRHHEPVARLRTLISRHPLHEVLYRHLMLALYRGGRRGEALAVYAMAQETLSAELGLEPCAALRELRHSILLASEGRENLLSTA